MHEQYYEQALYAFQGFKIKVNNNQHSKNHSPSATLI